MKRTLILFSAAIISLAFVFSSCKPSRVWATKEKEDKRYRSNEPVTPARYYNTVSLILQPTPGFVMKQNPNGKYYHRSQQGFTYWKGYDNRFYLDKSYLNRVSYSKWEYNEWKRYYRGNR